VTIAFGSAEPTPAAPILFGVQMPPGDLLPWSWALERLLGARNYWIATVRPDGRPHARPVWGVWQESRFWFSTGSLARHNLLVNPEITVHLENGDEVLVLEGIAEPVAGEVLAPALPAYNVKYSWTARATETGLTDDQGTVGPAFAVMPRVVFGWESDMRTPTRWTFA
jgi:hypothetical protein